MKVGDTFPVTVAGHVVAQARVAELTREKATLVVPGTVVVMAVNTSLAGKAPSENATETIVTGVDRQDNTTVVESGAPLETTAPDNATTDVADTTQSTTVETTTAADTSAATESTEVDNGSNE